MKIHFFIENLKFSCFFTFSTFSKKFHEIAFFLKKRADGAQDPPKCIVFHWSKEHSRQPAARVRQHFSLKKVKNLLHAFHEKRKFYENDEIFKNFKILDMSEPLVFPRKYLTFCVLSPFGGAGFPFLAPKHEILPILRFWSPKALLSLIHI